MKSREIILVAGGLSFILLIVFLSLLLSGKFNVQSCGCPKVIERNFVYLFILLAGIFVASLVYYLLSMKIETQKESITKNVSLVLTFLDRNEREVLNEVISGGGEFLQSELTRKFGKLKTHRAVRKLEEQGIINIEEHGKTTKITLKPELKKELVK